MKIYLTLVVPTLVLTFSLTSCNQRKSVEITTDAEKITMTDTTPIVATQDSIDSTSLDPQTHETALQQDPPTSKPTKTTSGCNVEYIQLPNPNKNHHIYQIKRFDASNSKCWYALENYGIKFCGDKMPCEISFIEFSNPPHNTDAAQLKKYGIGSFTFTNSTWEFRGAKIWGRAGKGYEYHNTNKY